MAFFIPVLLAHLPLGLLGFKLEDVLISTGPWVLVVSAIIVFIESGVLFPVLPGDSLIFALGMLHDRMGLSLWLAFPVLIIAAVAGGEVGYQLGARYGRNLFKDDAKIQAVKKALTSQKVKDFFKIMTFSRDNRCSFRHFLLLWYVQTIRIDTY